MTVSPIALPERRRGRPTIAADETSTPTGRALHRIEAVAFDISKHALDYRTLAELRILFDAEHDWNLADARRIVRECPTCHHTAGPRLDAAMAADEREDETAVRGDGIVDKIHAIGRQLAGWVEKAFAAMRSRG